MKTNCFGCHHPHPLGKGAVGSRSSTRGSGSSCLSQAGSTLSLGLSGYLWALIRSNWLMCEATASGLFFIALFGWEVVVLSFLWGLKGCFPLGCNGAGCCSGGQSYSYLTPQQSGGCFFTFMCLLLRWAQAFYCILWFGLSLFMKLVL